MKALLRRPGYAALATGGIATVVVLLAPAIASADPMADLAAPLLNSDCSFAQVDAALHAEAPQLASMLDANPDQKAELQRKFDQPVEQRRAEFQSMVEQNPDAAQQAQNDPRAPGLRDTIQTVADSCHSY
ncbi:hemophore-related protein [Nocardia australiensis]|uniref:hemophore-related protein n=1 Tax=Nocardia australiensis TaxID=2887191 RepID=UPI001D137C43|nr:hemophore-related protein [Nocardia australiensis]